MDVESETFATYAFQNMDTGFTSEVVDEDEPEDGTAGLEEDELHEHPAGAPGAHAATGGATAAPGAGYGPPDGSVPFGATTGAAAAHGGAPHVDQLLPAGTPINARVVGHVLARDSMHKLYALYVIHVHRPYDGLVWPVYRRYSEFRTVHDRLRKDGFAMAALPPKKMLGSFDPAFLESRRAGLEMWLLHLLGSGATPGARNPFLHPAFREFMAAQAGAPPPGVDMTTVSSAELSSVITAGIMYPGAATAPVPVGRASAPVPVHPGQAKAAAAAGPSAGGRGFAAAAAAATAAVPAPTATGVAGPTGTTPLSASAQLSVAAAQKREPLGLHHFELLRVIGKGSFGKVMLVRKKTGHTLYAMKALNKPNIKKRRQVDHTKTERRVLSYTNHPYIVSMHYAFQTAEKLYFVLDYCAGGELFFHLGKHGKFPENLAAFYAAEMTLALHHLHEKGVVYRDLKPENILLDADGHVKLADFGLSKEGITDTTQGTHSFCGTAEYLAPEILARRGHGTAVDWWCLGMVLHEMIVGIPPWYTRDRKKLFQRVQSAPLRFPPGVSPEAQEVIRGLLSRDPSTRFTAREVMSCRFFAHIDWNRLSKRELKPPYVPVIRRGSLDTSNFDREFTQMAVSNEDRPFAPSSKTFEGFTFVRDGEFLGSSAGVARSLGMAMGMGMAMAGAAGAGSAAASGAGADASAPRR